MCVSLTLYDWLNGCVRHSFFMDTIRPVERVCEAQNVCFISTTDSSQNIFLSNK